MSLQLEESLLDFNFDFLNQSATVLVPEKKDKCRTAISVTKKKIVATDCLIKKYYEKKEEVDQLEKALYTSKEECKRVCIDFQNITDKFNKLDNEVQVLRSVNQQLNVKCSEAENLVDAMQSHVHQLQNLVKENETVIEGLQIENRLEKANAKECDKKVSSFQKENDNLLKDIYLMKDIILGNRKLKKRYKDILQKYNKKYESDDNDSMLEVDSDDETDTHSNINSPIVPEETFKNEINVLSIQSLEKKYTTKIESVTPKHDNDLDSDFSNEQTSADTGRGSSLNFSDSDKCFHSPDYFMEHSPIDTEITDKIKNVAHMATSPIAFPDDLTECNLIDAEIAEKNKSNVVHMATSPIALFKFAYMAKSPIAVEQSAQSSMDCEANEITVTDLREEIPEVADKKKDGILGKCPSNSTISKNISYETPSSLEHCCQKACLELNNSNNINKNDSRDGEIEMILSKMRLTHNLITPIPTTPSKANNSSSLYDVVATESHQCRQNRNLVCKDALLVKEENTVLKASIVKLATEIETIKEILNNKHLLTQQQQMISMADNKYLSTRQQQVESKTSKETEFDYSDDDLIVIPDNADYNEATELENVESLDMEHINERISGKGSQSLNKCDIRKGIKRLEFEEPIPAVQNKFTEFPQSNQESDYQENKQCEIDHTTASIRKAYRQRKLTKLDRLRQKLRPKNRIKANFTPTRKSRKKQTSLRQTTAKAAMALKNKIAYEKAVKIMSDLKSQEKARGLKKVDGVEQRFKKKDSKPLNVPGSKTSTKTEFGTPSEIKLGKSTENLLKDHQISNDENAKRIVILEDILITSSQNYNDKVQFQQKPLDTSLLLSLDGSDTNIIPPKIALSLGEVKKSLENTDTELNIIAPNIALSLDEVKNSLEKISQVRVTEKDVPNNVVVSKNLDLQCSKESEHKKFDLSKNQNDLFYEPEDTERSDFNILIENELSLEIKNEISGMSRKDSNASIKSQILKMEQVEPITSNEDIQEPSSQKVIATRSRTKTIDISSYCDIKDNSVAVEKSIFDSPKHKNEDTKCDIQNKSRKRQKRMSVDKPEIECKRRLRSSSTLRLSSSDEYMKVSNNEINSVPCTDSKTAPKQQDHKNITTYDDLEMFNHINTEPHTCTTEIAKTNQIIHPKDSILCAMIEKYGIKSIKNYSKKIPDAVLNTISSTIDSEISAIINCNKDSKPAMDRFVETIKKWDCKQFMAGLMQYLKNPQRKIELFGKTCTPPAPPMTKSEQILLYVVLKLKQVWSSIDFVDCLLCNIEYVLFKLNRTPDFDTIESMSHFYAIICRYFKMKSRLRIFMLDAMYCIQFKSVPLIKQCMEVWMHVLPLAHMGIAKSTLVTCMVYLLHFYKCEDKFNRVQEIRFLLSRKYFYQITEWNEPKIIEMFKNAITNVRAVPVEMKLLRIALIVIAKRHGPKWCQKNIIKSLLLPMIESESYPERVKVFCFSILGPLLKPYPADMRIHLEIVMNKLLDTLNQNPSPAIEEAIFTSLIYMSRHNYKRVVQTLLTWKPQKISTEFEQVIHDFVCEKTLKMWKTTLSKMSVT